MTIFFGIYLIGVAVAYIVSLCMCAVHEGRITIGDLVIYLMMALFSWVTIACFLSEQVNWDTTIWKRKSKEEE